MSLTAEQIEARRDSIGASDAAPAIGVESFGRNRVTLWQEKTGRVARPEIDSRQIRRGNFLESWIASEFALEVGVEVRRAQPRQHPKYHWMTARPDYKVVGKPAIVECKSVSPFSLMDKSAWGESGTDEIPLAYLTQCVHQLIVTDAEVCYLAAMFADVLRVYVVSRNAALEDAVIAREEEFWSYVEVNQPPPPLTVDEVLELFPRDNAQRVVADEATLTDWAALLEVRRMLAEHEADEEALANRIKVFMSENAELTDSHGRALATWKAAKSGGVDWKGAALDLMDSIATQRAESTGMDVTTAKRVLLTQVEEKFSRPGSRKFLPKLPKDLK